MKRVLAATTTLAAISVALGCAGRAAAPGGGSGVELIMAHDAPAPEGAITFPNSGYESVVRFDLPPGEHRLRRLRVLAAAPGTLTLTLYDNSPLDAPGQVVHSLTREVAATDTSDGKDGRWLVNDLSPVPARAGVVWVGLRKAGGDPKVWASGFASEKAYMRNTDPANIMGLLPVKRSPMVRLEVGP